MRKLGPALVVVALLNALATNPAEAYPSGGALPPVLTQIITIAGRAGVPLDAVGVAVNVTVTNPAQPGFVTVYPCGDRPATSNINYVADQTVPNFVVTALSPDGEICIDTYATTDLIVDLAGYLPNGSPIITLPQPERLVDSRESKGVAGRLDARVTTEVQIGGRVGVPADAAMVLFNATAVNPSGPGFLTVFPCGVPTPATSTLNYTPGAVVPNFVVAKLGDGGKVCFSSYAPTDLLVDVAGYIPAGASDIVALTAPERLLDTRFGIGGPQVPMSAETRPLQIGGMRGVPSDATAVMVNLTATQSSGTGFVSAYPCGGTVPLVSNLNFTPRIDVANLAIVKLSPSGQLCLRANETVDVIADVTGYLTGNSAITALTPVRLFDSREIADPVCNTGVLVFGRTLVSYDLVTGAARPTPLVGGVNIPNGYVARDCEHVDVAWFDTVLASTFWFEKSAQSGVARSVPGDPASLIYTDAGPLYLARSSFGSPTMTYWSVRDALTGSTLFSLPPSTNGVPFWTPVGATSDGSMIVLSSRIGRGHPTITYWSADGGYLGEWDAPIESFNFSISPQGTYLAYSVSTGSVTVETYVVTLDGLLVAKLPAGPATAKNWISDGSMLACSTGPNQRAMRWDLFSSPKPLSPTPGVTLPCLFAAG